MLLVLSFPELFNDSPEFVKIKVRDEYAFVGFDEVIVGGILVLERFHGGVVFVLEVAEGCLIWLPIS